MALGLLLQVSCICFFLFDASAALPAVKGYGYPYMPDSHNIGDDGDDEVLTSPTFDQSNWQAVNNEQAGPVFTSYNKPQVAHQAEPVPSLPYAPSAPEVERLINGGARDWGQEEPDKLLLFPLNYQPSDPAKPQPGPLQPQSPSNAVPTPAYREPAPAYYKPATEAPSFDTWQPEPVSSGHGVTNSGPSAAGGDSSNIPHLVYEDIFQYPSENTESSSYAGGHGEANYYSPQEETTNEGAQPVYPAGFGSPSFSSSGGENLNFGQTHYQPRDDKISWRPQEPAVGTQKVSEPLPPPPPPSSYIVQSRNGYQRALYLLSHLKYSPEFPVPMPASVKGVKGPAPSQPAAPKGVKNPQRAKW